MLTTHQAGILDVPEQQGRRLTMRVIKMEFTGRLDAPSADLSAPAIRDNLFEHIVKLEGELTAAMTRRAGAYLPAGYRVFAASEPRADALGLTVDLWIVDPTLHWRTSFFARRAWRLLRPVLASAVSAAFADHVSNVSLVIDPATAKVSVYSPTRGWLDPVLVAAMTMAATSAYWMFGHAAIRSWLS
jgi:hypothetical protein